MQTGVRESVKVRSKIAKNALRARNSSMDVSERVTQECNTGSSLTLHHTAYTERAMVVEEVVPPGKPFLLSPFRAALRPPGSAGADRLVPLSLIHI